MTITTTKTVEPLYILMLHNNKNAEAIFKEWIRINQIEHAQVSGHKMMLHDRQSFEKFKITWTYSTNMLTIWDTWLRRHVYLD